MKNYKLYIGGFLWFILLILNGCYDLDQYPADSITAGTFWQDEEDAHEGMMGVYNAMKNDNAFAVYYTRDCLSDIGVGFNWGVYGFIEVAQASSNASSSVYSGVWSALYEGVARANTFLQHIDDVSMDDNTKVQYKAEAYFMRALFYNELLNLFGGVPLYDESTVIDKDYANMLNPRSSADEIRSFILNDLENACTYLPVSWDSDNMGRATQGAAQSLKGKVLLYNKQYNEAAIEFEKVMNSGEYSLYDNYANLFKPGGDESSEMIFAIQNLSGSSTQYGFPVHYIANRASYGGCINCLVPSNELADMYEYKDGRPFNWDDIFPGFTADNGVKEKVFRCTFDENGKYVATYPEYKDQLLAMYEKRDSRMAETIIMPYTLYKGWVNNAKADCEFVLPCGNETNGYVRNAFGYNSYLYRKFVPEYDMDGLISSRFHSPTNFPLIRYADILLMLAECDNQLGKQSEAVSLINQVRNRAEMPGLNSGPSYLSATTQEEIFERIKHERAIEFAAEGIRYSDLKRWGILVETVDGQAQNDLFGNTISTKSASDKFYLWPIPETEIEKNSSLTQNTGW
ncbi:MAG: RagB/SusD family nutrient uptake outer membrane protein [Massilibacteroides sp.]|nr:RagB/SusD family nutrient uptake outer membrane protein [Massilibacteroides sp.]MDD3061238.1 RagB/SusD family nutrient uptake outer membrane protein [Massilibacteroides sp.]MDD4115677.1 RagB/SusD family nutrient uptake outer membrane protein [Massilibacteroides sp.]MDD4661293.1 RagB/SusD family nutrient uptake outer membrane protein [Massilibacteroides sp.]